MNESIFFFFNETDSYRKIYEYTSMRIFLRKRLQKKNQILIKFKLSITHQTRQSKHLAYRTYPSISKFHPFTYQRVWEQEDTARINFDKSLWHCHDAVCMTHPLTHTHTHTPSLLCAISQREWKKKNYRLAKMSFTCICIYTCVYNILALGQTYRLK